MSFLEDMAGQVLGGALNSGQGGNLLSSLVGMINSQPGGLSGLIQTLQQNGLGGAVSSWVGTGANQAVSGDQIQSALGGGLLSELAQKVGLPESEVGSQVASLLPGLVDHLTPGGELPAGLETIGMDLLKGFLSKGAGA